jgi:hypothetical protein
MKAWQIALWGLACLSAAGCRSNPEITALQRENRYLEDRIYDLQDEADRAKEDLDKCRRANPSQRSKNAPVSTQIETSTGSGRPSRGGSPPLVAPGSSRPSGEADDGLPKIIVETPKESLPQNETPDILKRPLASPKSSPQSPPKPKSGSSSSEAPKFSPGPDAPRGSNPPPGAEPLPEPGRLNAPGGPSANPRTSQSVGPAVSAADFHPPPATGHPPPAQSVIPVSGITLLPGTDSARVDRITLNRLAVGGWDADGRPGDDGIVLLVEPRDAEGRLIAAAGPISVVLLDRGLPGEAARVARWDLIAHQVAGHFRRMPAGDGIYLELPWPGAPPVHSHLHLFVRFTTRDGRNLEANRELDIALANQSRAETRTAVGPASRPSEAVASWRATRLPPENLDERRTGETSVPPTSSSDDAPPTQEPRSALVDRDSLPGPARPAGETPAPRNRPVWSPDRR